MRALSWRESREAKWLPVYIWKSSMNSKRFDKLEATYTRLMLKSHYSAVINTIHYNLIT